MSGKKTCGTPSFWIRGDVYSICVLAKAAYHLDVKPLIDLTSRELASRLMTLTSEEMMEVFDKKQEKDLLPLQDKNPPVFLRQADIFRRDFGLTGGTTAVIEQAYDLIICDRLDQIKPKATKQKAKQVYEALIKRQEHLGITMEELGREVGSVRMSTASDSADASLPNGFVRTRDGRVFVDPKSGIKKATINATENNMMLQKSKDNTSKLKKWQHASDSVKSGQAKVVMAQIPTYKVRQKCMEEAQCSKRVLIKKRKRAVHKDNVIQQKMILLRIYIANRWTIF